MRSLLSLVVLVLASVSSLNGAGPPMRAMWVYKTAAILTSPSEQQSLFAFCQERQITDLFWQVHFDRTDGMKLKDQEATHLFLKAAHAKAIRVHTLGGDPAHTLTKNHERVLAMADGILAFNQAGEPLDGMHLDVEPHALPAWKKSTDAEKGDLLTHFVDLHTKVAEKLHTADPRLQYGADIVFWLNKQKPDGSIAYPVTYRGVTKDPAALLLDVVDNVGIMSYRDKTEGKNGIIAIVEKTIAAADRARGRAFVGVKIADIGPRNEGFFGRTEAEMMGELKKVDDAYAGHRGYAGLCFFTYEAFKVMPR